MRNKLKDNRDHYAIDHEQMSYVVTRLDGKAFTQYRTRNKTNSKSFENAEDIIKLMIKLFEDSNHKRIVKRNFKNLKQKSSQSFNEFYHEFLRLFNELNSSKNDLIDELLDKLNTRIKRARLGNTKNFYSLDDAQRKLQKLDNNLFRHDKETREYGSSSKPTKSIATRAPRAATAPTRASSIVANAYKNKTSNSDKSKSYKERKEDMNLVTRAIIEEGRCLCCGKFDHKSRYCPNQGKKDSTYLEQRVHAMNLEKSHDHDYDEANDTFDEGKYSKNNSPSTSPPSRAEN